jgi:molybdate transport system substrate-binding protein
MNTSRTAGFAAAIAAVLCLGPASAQDAASTPKLATAQPGDVRIFVAGSMRAPVTAVKAQLEKATGHKVVIEAGESKTLQGEIEAGQPFEVAFLTTAVIDAVAGEGKTVAGSTTPIAVVRIGVSVRGDAPKLDVTTPEGLKKALLGAHSIRRFFGVAASVPIVKNIFDKLDLNEATKDKLVLINNEQPVPEAPLAPGQYELIINLISAIIPMKGWTYLGPIPEQFQMPVPHAAALGATGNAVLGRQVIAVMKSPEFEAALKANGITRQ